MARRKVTTPCHPATWTHLLQLERALRLRLRPTSSQAPRPQSLAHSQRAGQHSGGALPQRPIK